MPTKRSFLLLSLLTLFVSLFSNPVQTEIKQGWKFRQSRLTNWYPATVPGVIQTDLIDNGIIEDPFFRLNERAVQWVDKEDWMYETYFDLSDQVLNKENIRLHFMGLDTYADVYLNGHPILNADNMFREWKVDVKKWLQPKNNKLEVFFHSPIKIDIPKWDALPYQYRTGPDQAENGGIFNKRISIFARKAGYHYGWDWGPRLVTMGIWRPVYLESWDDLKVESIYFNQKQVDKKKASLAAQIEMISDTACSNVKITVKDKLSGKVYSSHTTDLLKGNNVIQFDFEVKNPILWWCNGLGKPHLYTWETTIETASGSTYTIDQRIGLRSLKVINHKDQQGTAFYFELNGERVFAKGANYIPSDNFLPRVSDQKYKQTILDAVNANMNMLRVWGGGIYENDIFYDLCDELGIMVWQDFMFACSLYPSEGKFLESIRQEAADNIKRLRNHPSIALWCGNNEVNEFWIAWGYRETYSSINKETEEKVWKQYYDLFHGALPDAVNQYSPGMFYWPSSPYSSGPNDETNNDRHYWGVWHGRHETDRFNKERSRFFSEYGFQSFPEFESVQLFAPDSSDWSITSEVMNLHQRAGTYANPLIEEYLIKEYKKPTSFEEFLYMSQVLQGDAIKKAMEAHRREMPFCMGTLFWQHNDCWPVASWSSRDYYGRWKAQHYFAREAYKDLLLSSVVKDSLFSLYLVSDRRSAGKGRLEISVATLWGDPIHKIVKNINIPRNNSQVVHQEPLSDLVKGSDLSSLYIRVSLTDAKGKQYLNRFFPLLQKNVAYPKAKISYQVESADKGCWITLSSDQYARAVFLSLDGIDNFFDNNYFDMEPGQSVRLFVRTTLSSDQVKKQLKIRHYNM